MQRNYLKDISFSFWSYHSFFDILFCNVSWKKKKFLVDEKFEEKKSHEFKISIWNGAIYLNFFCFDANVFSFYSISFFNRHIMHYDCMIISHWTTIGKWKATTTIKKLFNEVNLVNGKLKQKLMCYGSGIPSMHYKN